MRLAAVGREVAGRLPRESVARRHLAIRGGRRRSHAEHTAAFIALSFRGALRPVARSPADNNRDKGAATADFALQEHFLETARSFGTDIMRRLLNACVEAAHLGGMADVRRYSGFWESLSPQALSQPGRAPTALS